MALMHDNHQKITSNYNPNGFETKWLPEEDQQNMIRMDAKKINLMNYLFECVV